MPDPIDSKAGTAPAPSARRWGILAVASAVIFVVYTMQYQVAALAYQLIPALNLDALELSNLMFIPMLTAAAAGLPLGALADRYGARRVVGLSLIVSAFGSVLRIFATCYGNMLVGCMLIGFAPAALNANVMRIFGLWFEDRASFAIGIYYAASGLGAATAMLSSAVVGSASDAFILSSAILFATIAAWWAIVRDAPRNCSGAFGETTSLASLAEASKSSVVWFVALATGFGLAAKTAYLSFLPQAIAGAVSVQDANWLAAFATYGGILGCALGPAVCSRMGRPKVFVVVIAVASSTLIAATAFTLGNPQALLFFAVGMVSSVTAPIVEAVPCSVASLRRCISSAGGIIGSASLALSYLLPLGITALSGGNSTVSMLLTGLCFALMIPFLALLPFGRRS